jgi:hypothetical protein
VKNKEKLETTLKTAKAKVTARADKVKAIEKTFEEFRVEKEKQVDKKIETETSVSLPPHFVTTSNISILTINHFYPYFQYFYLNLQSICIRSPFSNIYLWKSQ